MDRTWSSLPTRVRVRPVDQFSWPQLVQLNTLLASHHAKSRALCRVGLSLGRDLSSDLHMAVLGQATQKASPADSQIEEKRKRRAPFPKRDSPAKTRHHKMALNLFRPAGRMNVNLANAMREWTPDQAVSASAVPMLAPVRRSCARAKGCRLTGRSCAGRWTRRRASCCWRSTCPTSRRPTSTCATCPTSASSAPFRVVPALTPLPRNKLTVAGSFDRNKQAQRAGYSYAERAAGTYRRVLTLPADADAKVRGRGAPGRTR